MRTYLVIIVLLLAYQLRSSAQAIVPTLSWLQGTSSGNASSTIIQTDKAGNVYVTGFYSGTIDFDAKQTSDNIYSASQSADIFLVKYNAEGKVLWAKTIGGLEHERCQNMKVDAEGTIYLSGIFSGKSDFDPSSDSTFLISPSFQNQVFIAKYSTEGNLIWAKDIHASTGYGLDIDKEGFLYLAGDYASSNDFDPSQDSVSFPTISNNAFVAKYDRNGNYRWAKGLTSTSSHCNAVTLDGNGNLYITGAFVHDMSFKLGDSASTVRSKAFNTLFIAQLDTSGTYNWATGMDAENLWSGGRILCPTPQGDILMAGDFGGSLFDRDSIKLLESVNASSDIFFAKYDSQGRLKWIERTGGNFADVLGGIAVDSSGNFIATGSLVLSVSSNREGNARLEALGTENANVFLTKYDLEGQPIWTEEFGNDKADRGTSVAWDQKGNIYLTGTYQGTVDFDPSDADSLLRTDYTEVFVTKYKETLLTTSLHSPLVEKGNLLCPNPSQGLFQLTTEVEKIHVTNPMGLRIVEFENVRQLDLRSYPKGMYLVDIQMGNTVYVQRAFIY